MSTSAKVPFNHFRMFLIPHSRGNTTDQIHSIQTGGKYLEPKFIQMSRKMMQTSIYFKGIASVEPNALESHTVQIAPQEHYQWSNQISHHTWFLRDSDISLKWGSNVRHDLQFSDLSKILLNYKHVFSVWHHDFWTSLHMLMLYKFSHYAGIYRSTAWDVKAFISGIHANSPANPLQAWNRWCHRCGGKLDGGALASDVNQ